MSRPLAERYFMMGLSAACECEGDDVSIERMCSKNVHND